MGNISKSKTWSDDEELNASDLNQGFDDIINEANGNLNSDNVDSISVSKITNQYKFKTTLSSGQTIANGSTATLKFDSVSYDSNNDFDMGTYKYTVSLTGYYQLNARAYLYYGGSKFNDPRIDLYIQKNGSTILGDQNRFELGSVSSEGLTAKISDAVKLTGGDVIKVVVRTGYSSGSPNILGGDRYTGFSGHLISTT